MLGQGGGGDKVGAERDVAPFTRHARRHRLPLHHAHGNRWVRLLVGLQNIAAPDLRVDVVNTDVPEIPLEIKRRRGLPELENHVDAFHSHQAQDRGIRGQVKEAEVALNAALAKAAHQAPARQMVEIGQTHGNVGGMVKRHKRYAGAKADLFGAGQGVGNKEIVGGDRLPLHRMMLADPGFAVAQLISQDDEFQMGKGCFCAWMSPQISGDLRINVSGVPDSVDGQAQVANVDVKVETATVSIAQRGYAVKW